MKPNLILDEEKLRAGIDKQSYDFTVNLKTDLIAVLEFMIANKDKLKIDLQFYQIEQEWEFYECGTYRCVAGWWAFWLGIPVKDDKGDLTNRFKDIFHSDDLCKGFVRKDLDLGFDSCDYEIFGSGKSVPERLKLVKSLKIKK